MSATHLSISVHKSKSTSANQQHHTERFDNKHKHTNESIDPSKSDQNINLRPDLQGTYNQRFNKIMDEHYTGRRKKDGTPWLASGKNASIKLLQISVNIGEVDDDGKPITKMTDEELVKLYRDDIYPMLEEEYGRENIVGAAIHLDESKPHLHIDVVPLTEDGRLSAKEIVGGKGKMHQNQSKWLKQMQEKRPDLNFVRKKEGVNGLELDKLKELTAIAEDKGEEKALNVLMSMHKQEKAKWDKEWERIETADKELEAKAKEVTEQEQKNDATRDELNAVVGPLKKLSDKLVKKTRDVDKRETALNGRERALKGRENMLNERTRALDERESRLNETADKLADERTRERTNALDERESRLNETADKLADERTRERTNALDERESRLNETVDKLADERTRERTRALDVRESQLDQEVETRVSKIKSAFVCAFKQLPKIKDTLMMYVKKAREKDEEERKAREEQAERLAEITDVKTEQLADAIEREDIKQVAKHTKHLEQINEVSTEIDESQFEMSADTLENKIDNLEIEIDESQFEVPDQNQKTL